MRMCVIVCVQWKNNTDNLFVVCIASSWVSRQCPTTSLARTAAGGDTSAVAQARQRAAVAPPVAVAAMTAMHTWSLGKEKALSLGLFNHILLVVLHKQGISTLESSYLLSSVFFQAYRCPSYNMVFRHVYGILNEA